MSSICKVKTNFNKTAVEYSASINKNLTAVCRPALEQLNLFDVTYINFINKNKRFFISTNHNWVTYYIEYGLYDNKEHNAIWQKVVFHQENNIRYALWDSFGETDVFKAAFSHDMYNGFFVFNGHELFSFSSNSNAANNTLMYLNNLKYFEKFIAYFKSKMQGMLNNIEKTAIITSNIEDNNNEKPQLQIQKSPISSPTQKKFFLGKNFPNQYLTLAEFRCVLHMLQGKTMKEVAKNLAISNRTVETYVANAKDRLKCLTKTQLLELIQKSDLNYILEGHYYEI